MNPRSRSDEVGQLVEALSLVVTRAVVVVERLRRVLEAGAKASASRRAGPSSRVGRYSQPVHRAVCYLEAHYEEEISLTRLAVVAGCARRQLTHAFRRETGVTVHTYLMRVRMERAALEVQAGDKIEAVMLGVGYRSKTNFYRQFKARFGKTPAAYRMGEAAALVEDDEVPDGGGSDEVTMNGSGGGASDLGATTRGGL